MSTEPSPITWKPDDSIIDPFTVELVVNDDTTADSLIDQLWRAIDNQSEALTKQGQSATKWDDPEERARMTRCFRASRNLDMLLRQLQHLRGR